MGGRGGVERASGGGGGGGKETESLRVDIQRER